MQMEGQGSVGVFSQTEEVEEEVDSYEQEVQALYVA